LNFTFAGLELYIYIVCFVFGLDIWFGLLVSDFLVFWFFIFSFLGLDAHVTKKSFFRKNGF